MIWNQRDLMMSLDGLGGKNRTRELTIYSVVDLLKNVLRPKTNRYRKFVTCNILT